MNRPEAVIAEQTAVVTLNIFIAQTVKWHRLAAEQGCTGAKPKNRL